MDGVRNLASNGTRKPGKKAKARQPITSHPLFPITVGLWFAALFCLGSLAIRPGLIESLVLKAHIDLILPAAAPPLGAKARMLIALAMAVAGGALGLAVARLIARPRQVVQERRRGHAAAPVAEPQVARRRSLTPLQDHAPDYAREFAPVPGGAPQILDVNEFDFVLDSPIAEPAAAAPAEARAPLPLAPSPAEPGALDLSGYLSGDIAPEPAAAAPILPTDSAKQAQQAEAAAPARLFDKDSTIIAPPPQPDVVVLDPQRPFAAPAGIAAEPLELAEPASEAPQVEISPIAEPVAAVADLSVDEPDDDAGQLDEMTSLELIERLARSLKKRRQRPAAPLPPAAYAVAEREVPPARPPARPPVHEAAPEAAAPIIPEAAAEAIPQASATVTLPRLQALQIEVADSSGAIIPPPMPMPAALRPIALALADDDSEVLTARIPPRRISMPSAPAEPASEGEAPLALEAQALDAEDAPLLEPKDEPQDDAGEDLSDGYSSLLELSRPAQPRHGFIRIEEPEAEAAAIEPVVVFPGQAGRPFAAPGNAVAIDVPADLSALATRRFDAPPAGMAPGVTLAAQSQSPEDRQQAEQALRAALATLQRMSGAA